MIRIAQRYRPFTHTPGRTAPVPGSHWTVTGYPTQLLFVKGEQQHRVTWQLDAPLEHFTFLLDLERACVRLFGRTKQTYFALEITHAEQLILQYAKGSPRTFQLDGIEHALAPKGRLCIAEESIIQHPCVERLALGCHKKQEVDRMLQRGDLCELFPILFHLGQHYPSCPRIPLTSMEEGKALCKAHFRDLWTAQVFDVQHQGFLPLVAQKFVVTDLYAAAYQSIRSLFIEESEQGIHLLPQRWSTFHAGRLLSAQCSQAIVDLHWTKKQLFKVQIQALQEGEVPLLLPPAIRQFRYKTHIKERGIYQKADIPLVLQKGKRYFLDKFTR